MMPLTPPSAHASLALLLGGATLLGAPALADLGPRPAKPADLTVYITGNANDAVVSTANGPALLLMGGGGEVTKAFANRAFPLIPGGDIVVLRTSGSDGYQDYFYSGVTTGPNRPDSVETMLVNSRAKANSDYAEWVLAGAEMIWMAGGDQSTYTGNWRGTKVEQGLRDAWARGAIIGGTSAGMAVAGEFIYDPDGVSSLTSAQALGNPYHPNLLISARLFDCEWMDGVITDTHFRNRDRMGRSLAMMAHLREEGRAGVIRGIALSEQSSLFIGSNGIGTVDITNGDALYVMMEDASTVRTQVNPGQPLIYGNVKRHRLVDGQTFDFNTWTTSVPAMTLSVDGAASVPFTPADPYGEPDPEGPPANAILYEPFEGSQTLVQRGFTVLNVQAGTNTWTLSTSVGKAGQAASINFDDDAPKDDWLLTPPMALEGGVEHAVEFWYRGGTSSNYFEDFDVYFGRGTTAASYTGSGTLLASFEGINGSNAPATASLLFTPPESRTDWRVAFHSRSATDQARAQVDDLVIYPLPVITSAMDAWMFLAE